MKKILSIVLVLVFAFSAVALAETTPAATIEPDVKGEGVMSYAEYAAAELETEVTIETYVQAKQSWWNDQATFYTQDKEGAYFLYNMPCTEEQYAQLVPGTKIKVTGYKTAWAGEVEIVDATFEILEGSYIAETTDATELLAAENLIDSQNMFVTFKGMTIEAVNEAGDAFQYNWDGSGEVGSDIDLYFKASVNGQTYTFVVYYYVCDANGVYGAETETYQAVQALKVGDVVDLEGFLYWYEGAQPHITAVSAAAAE